MFVLATACDDYYAAEALNLVSSVLNKSPVFDQILVYDLGMTARQRRLFRNLPNVTVRSVPAFTEHWRQCWSWKPWVLIDAAKKADGLLYLDAGVEVLGSLDGVIDTISKHGYFVVSQLEALDQGHTVGQIIPEEFYKKFSIPRSIASKQVIAGGLIGFTKDSAFYRQVVERCMELTLDGFNLGWSKVELFRNRGINYLPQPPIRDCELFRHDQTLINMFFYKSIKSPHIEPMRRFGATNPNLASDQLFWSSRKLGSLKYTYRAPYSKLRTIRNVYNFVFISLRQQIWLTVRPLVDRIRRKINWLRSDEPT